MKLKDLVTHERARLNLFWYLTHDIGTYLGRGVTIGRTVYDVNCKLHMSLLKIAHASQKHSHSIWNLLHLTDFHKTQADFKTCGFQI